MADMDDSYTPTPTSTSNETTSATTASSSDSTSIPTSFTSSTTSSFSFGTASHAQRPHLNSTTSASTSSPSTFSDFNFSSTSTSTSPSISLPSFTSPQPHKRTSEAVNGDIVDDDEDDDERGHASKRKYQREEQDEDEQDREEEEKGTMNDSSGPDDSFMDLLNIFSKLNFPEGQPEPCPLCPLTFPIKEFAAHVYKCIKQLDEVDREQQERADAQLAYKIATEVGAEEDQFFYSRPASTDEDMSSTTQRRKCKDGIRCKRVDARHFIDIEHPPVSCPICEQQYPVYELDAHITICLTQPQQPKPAFSQTSGTSFSTIAGDADMDGSNSNSNSNSNNAFSSSAFTSIRDDIAQPSPSPPLPAKIVFGEDLNDDDDRDDSKDTPIRRSASAGANIGRHQLTLEQAAAMASLVVDQQSKSAANQDYSLVDLLDTFKTLGFTQENLTHLSKTIDSNKQTTTSVTSPPPPQTSSSQPTSSTT